MQLIQEMISVRSRTAHRRCATFLIHSCGDMYVTVHNRVIGPYGPNVAHTRAGDRVGGRCAQHYEGHTDAGPRQEEPYSEHDNAEKVSNAWCVH